MSLSLSLLFSQGRPASPDLSRPSDGLSAAVRAERGEMPPLLAVPGDGKGRPWPPISFGRSRGERNQALPCQRERECCKISSRAFSSAKVSAIRTRPRPWPPTVALAQKMALNVKNDRSCRDPRQRGREETDSRLQALTFCRKRGRTAGGRRDPLLSVGVSVNR